LAKPEFRQPGIRSRQWGWALSYLLGSRYARQARDLGLIRGDVGKESSWPAAASPGAAAHRFSRAGFRSLRWAHQFRLAWLAAFSGTSHLSPRVPEEPSAKNRPRFDFRPSAQVRENPRTPHPDADVVRQLPAR
jgi:hypothetical protein